VNELISPRSGDRI